MTKKNDSVVEMHLINTFAKIFKDSGWSEDAIHAWGKAEVKKIFRVYGHEMAEVGPAPATDKALAWAKRNPWYGDPAYNGKTSFAYSIHRYLANKGVDLESDAYYEELDKRLSQWVRPFHDVYPPNEFEEKEE